MFDVPLPNDIVLCGPQTFVCRIADKFLHTLTVIILFCILLKDGIVVHPNIRDRTQCLDYYLLDIIFYMYICNKLILVRFVMFLIPVSTYLGVLVMPLACRL